MGWDGRWVMDVTLGNVVQGQLGTVGSIAVDARTGEILYSEEDDAQVRARQD